MRYQNKHVSLYWIVNQLCVANNGKDTKHTIHIEWVIHLLRCITDSWNLILRYCSRIYNALLSELFIQAIINT